MITTVGEIRIHLEGIGHLLQDSKLAVPPYQRSYAWTEKNVTQLFTDLATAIIEGDSEYFLGSIVLIGASGEWPSVVDGQQRLATAAILIAAIRDYFDQKGDVQRVNKIESDYLLETDLRTQEPTPKLKLNATDNDFFFKRVLTRVSDSRRNERATKESHERIARAAEIASRQIIGIAEATNDPTTRLIDWLDFLAKRARVIRIQVQDSANAFRIFETLNDRGLKLALSDLLKNYLFHQSGDRIAEAQDSWISMAAILETVEDEEIIVDYIRHLWSSEAGLTREKVLYDRIRERITSKQKAVDFASRLAKTARTYAAIINTDNDLWLKYGTETTAYMATLNLMGMTQIRPLLLAILERFGPNEVKRSLRLFVAWAVRFLIVGGVGGGTLENHYAERAKEVTAEKIKTASGLMKEMRTVVPPDDAFQTAFGTATVSRLPLARYYLRVLERQVRGEKEPEFVPNPNEEEVSLEHVLPQAVTKDWRHFDTETAQAYVKRLGNLALMKKKRNETIGNQSFGEKARAYATSEFRMTAEIPSYAVKGAWTQESIDKRQRRMAELALMAWLVKVS